jgi:hypothetical protein
MHKVYVSELGWCGLQRWILASHFSTGGHERSPKSATKNWQLSVHFYRLTVHLLNFEKNQLH